MNQSFAEVIESSLIIWKAQSWHWDVFPAFGSLITIATPERTVFGLVYHIQTESLDGNRTPFAYQKTEEELKNQQPQIFEFLQTTFSCLTVGFLEHNKLLYQLAPEPPKIHAFVSHARTEETCQFFSDEQYLHLLFNAGHHIVTLDELLLAILKKRSELGLLNQEQIARFIETFSLLTSNDYRRLKLFLQRARHVINLST